MLCTDLYRQGKCLGLHHLWNSGFLVVVVVVRVVIVAAAVDDDGAEYLTGTVDMCVGGMLLFSRMRFIQEDRSNL